MQRLTLTPRPDWPAKAAELGFTYHTHDGGPYWDESAYYVLTAAEIDTLEVAANTLHQLCLDAAQVVIERGWWSRLGIPERAVHARGSAAHGHFQVYKSMQPFTCADFLQEPGQRTPVFVRFSTVAGGAGSADTVRDVRGFAVKF